MIRSAHSLHHQMGGALFLVQR